MTAYCLVVYKAHAGILLQSPVRWGFEFTDGEVKNSDHVRELVRAKSSTGSSSRCTLLSVCYTYIFYQKNIITTFKE
jgi:hypothetical protein